MRWKVLVVTVTLALGPSRSARADDPWSADKALHFGVSAALAGGCYAGSALVLERRWARAVTGGTLALAAGATKELWDLAGHGDPSWADFAWDVAGVAVGVGIGLAIDYAVGRAPPARAASAALLRF